MKRLRIFKAFCLMAVLLAISSPAYAVNWEWEWHNPMPQGNAFRGVGGTSSSDIFAVGDRGLILHNDGDGWTRIYQTLTEDELNGVWGTSESNIFIIGEFGVILHYNGSTWTKMNSGTPFSLKGIWGSSASDIFAVGGDWGNGLILHYDGTAWSKMSVSGPVEKLRGVWGTSDKDVFAVGDNGLILHYDGNTWTKMTSGTGSSLNSVWGTAADNVYAVGGVVSGVATILHYDGKNWSSMPNPAWDALCSIWGTSSANIFAVGYSGMLIHFDGSKWTKLSGGSSGLGIWGSSETQIFTVGEAGEIVHYDGNSWKKIYPTADSILFAIKSGIKLSDDLSFVVGQKRIILKYDGSLWKKVTSYTTGIFYSIWGKEWTDVFAVGESSATSGSIFHYDGNSWQDMNVSGIPSLYGVSGSSKNHVIAVGKAGTILRYDGSTWTSIISGTSNNLKSVWLSPAGNFFAAGDAGTILSCTDSACTAMTSNTIKSLSGIWGTSESNIYAVGQDGTVLRYNGSVWASVSTGGPKFWYYTVGGSSANDVFVAGGFGTILHYDGSSWTKMNSSTINDIYSIWGDSTTEMFVGGGSAMILHHSPIFVAPRALEISEPDGKSAFNVRLIAQPTADVTIKLFTSNPSECTVSPESVTLNSSNWLNGVNATVTAEYDGIIDGSQLCRIFTAKAESGDPKYNGVNPADVTVTVLDDSPGVAIFSVYPTYGTTGQSMTVTIRGQGFDANTKAYLRPVAGGAEVQITPLTLKDENTLSSTIPASSTGNYTIRVAGVSNSHEMINAVSFADASVIASQARKKAILVAGGPYLDNVLWKSVRNCTNRAYSALYSQGYTDDSIYYLSVEPYDVNGDGNNDVDGYSSLSALSYAITTWAKNNTDEVILYMVGIGESGSLTLNDKEKLDAPTLAGWINDLQAAIPGRIVVVYDASMSGSFMPVLKAPAGKQRVVMTGTTPDQSAYFLNDGELSFSYMFWSSILYTGKVYQSYTEAKAGLVSPQTPMSDADGDGVADVTARSKRENTEIVIGRGRSIETNAPKIGRVSPPQSLYLGQTGAGLWAWNITAANNISRVEARIYPPSGYAYCPQELIGSVSPYLKLPGPDAESKYKNTYSAFILLGRYDIYVYATDMKDYDSLPAQTSVSKSESVLPPPPVLEPDTQPCTVSIAAPEMISVAGTTAVAKSSVPKCLLSLIAERGFYWWSETEASGLVAAPAGEEEAYSMTVTGLRSLRTYTIRAYAKTKAGEIIAGEATTFTTAAPRIPQVHTTAEYVLSDTGITASGEITDVGGDAVSIYGFVYAKHPEPTVWDMALAFAWDTALPIATGKKFSGSVSRLCPGTYYIRSYAHNTFGTAYGEEFSFTVRALLPGDLNGDSYVDLADMILTLRVLSGIPVNETASFSADISGDCRIGMEEAVYILQKTAGLR